jgi:hypothetical protein
MDKSICGPLCLRIFDPFPISQPADSHLVVAVELKSAETAKFAGLPWPWTKPWGERPNFTMVHDTKISIVYGVYKLYIYSYLIPIYPICFFGVTRKFVS